MHENCKCLERGKCDYTKAKRKCDVANDLPNDEKLRSFLNIFYRWIKTMASWTLYRLEFTKKIMMMLWRSHKMGKYLVQTEQVDTQAHMQAYTGKCGQSINETRRREPATHWQDFVITRSDIYFQLFGRLCCLFIPAVSCCRRRRRRATCCSICAVNEEHFQSHSWHLRASTDDIYDVKLTMSHLVFIVHWRHVLTFNRTSYTMLPNCHALRLGPIVKTHSSSPWMPTVDK